MKKRKVKITKTGYLPDSPDRHNDMNIIPSNQITMKEVPFPIVGIDNLGNKQTMMPGGEYNFPGDYVTEIPMGKYQEGGGNFKTKLSTEEEEQFKKFFQTLPGNLRSDDSMYDIRGYWDASGRPEEFDYSQPTQEDGYYHAFSRHPETGKILKAPTHPTFSYAVDKTPLGDDTYVPLIGVDGNVYMRDLNWDSQQAFEEDTYKQGGIYLGKYEFKDGGLVKAAEGTQTNFRRTNIDKSKVLSLQKELKNAGYDLGKSGKTKDGVDGVWGPKTEKAYADFIVKQQEQAVVRPDEVFNEEGSVDYQMPQQPIQQAAQVQQPAPVPQAVIPQVPVQTSNSFSDLDFNSDDLRSRYSQLVQGLDKKNKQLEAEQQRVSKVRSNVIPTASKIANADNFTQDKAWWNTQEGKDYSAFLNAKNPQDLEAARKKLSTRVKDLLPNDGRYTVSKWDKEANAWNPQNKPSRELYCTPYGCFTYQEAGASDVPIVPGNMGFQSMVGNGSLPFEKVSKPEPGDVGLLIGHSPKDYSNPSLGYMDRAHHTTIYSGTGADGVINAYNADDGVRLDYELGRFPLSPNDSKSGSKKFEYYRYVGQTKKMQKDIEKSKKELAEIEGKIAEYNNRPIEYMQGKDVTSIRSSMPELFLPQQPLNEDLVNRQYGGSSVRNFRMQDGGIYMGTYEFKDGGLVRMQEKNGGSVRKVKIKSLPRKNQ